MKIKVKKLQDNKPLSLFSLLEAIYKLDGSEPFTLRVAQGRAQQAQEIIDNPSILGRVLRGNVKILTDGGNSKEWALIANNGEMLFSRGDDSNTAQTLEEITIQ